MYSSQTRTVHICLLNAVRSRSAHSGQIHIYVGRARARSRFASGVGFCNAAAAAAAATAVSIEFGPATVYYTICPIELARVVARA